jgi:tetratricopeptide (TPR) repeat protein
MEHTGTQFNPRQGWALAGWALLFLLCAIAYWPGLAGPFVFDDFGSIADLGDLGGVTDWNTFKAFVFGGHAGPTGRPLALASFLIDGNNWPTDPWPFKRTNLVIHLMNGAVLGLLLTKILEVMDVSRSRRPWVCLLAVACWLLHPFLVSTTLYAVQRMAQLSALFIFLGLLGYLHGRLLLAKNELRGYLLMSFSLGAGTLLSMLSKENGILLPTLAAVLEITVLASRRQHLASLNRYWAVVFLLLPTLVIFAFLGRQILGPEFLNTANGRDFSIYERLLTQGRILADYLQHWFVPELYTTGVFQDHFVKSTGILSPPTTLISAVLHAAAIAFAFVKRKQLPLLAFAILFFYAGHLIESTVINLELYFEHRNYVAAAFLFVPLVTLLSEKANARVFVAVALLAVCVLAGFTRYSASIWKDYPGIVAASAQKAPTSARAQQQHATNLYNAQEYNAALQLLDRAIETIPGTTQLPLSRATMLCRLGLLQSDEFSRISQYLSARAYSARYYELFTTFNMAIVDGNCPDVTLDALRNMYLQMLRHPPNGQAGTAGYSQLRFFEGFVDVHLGEPERAATAFNDSLASRPGAGHAMFMAALFASNEFYEYALQFSDIALRQLDSGDSDQLRGTRVLRQDVVDFQREVHKHL